MPTQNFTPIPPTPFSGIQVAVGKAFGVSTSLEIGPSTMAEWSVEAIILALQVKYTETFWESNAGAWAALAAKKSELEAQNAQLATMEPKAPSEFVVDELQVQRKGIQAEIQEVIREQKEFLLSSIREGMRDSPIYIVARLFSGGELLWIQILDLRRILVKAEGEFPGERSALTNAYLESGEFRDSFPIPYNLRPGQTMQLKLEIVGPSVPIPITFGPSLDNTEPLGTNALTVSRAAIVYTPSEREIR